MSLGMWKDSAIDLAAMAKSKEESTENSDSFLPTNEGDTAEVSLVKGVSNDSNPVLTDITRPSSNAESSREEGSVRSLPTSVACSPTPEEVNAAQEQTDGRYSAFNSDYSEYGSYDMEYPYAAPTVLGAKQSSSNFFCCLLAPWFGKKGQDKLEESYEEEKGPDCANDEEKVADQKLEKKITQDDDDLSTGSEIYGEKLTDQDRLAVMARLRVSETDPAHVETPFHASPTQQTGLEFEPTSEDLTPEKQDGTTKPGTPKFKGILKTSSTVAAPAVVSARSSVTGATGRRSLFVTTYEKKLHPEKHACFSPMARVVTVKSCNDMSVMEKSSIWWQKSDYDSFKKAGRLIAKAMIEGGSEIWLTNMSRSPATKSRQIQRSMTDGVQKMRSELRQEPGDETSSNDFGNKWWCKFGHSRRGLEHIASVEEGRQRQNNVRLAVRAVLDEQRRQKMYGRNDPERLRSVNLKHTSWARDLALASGAADAESVRSNFSESAKSRAFYLQKQASASGGTARYVPAFMDPSISKLQTSLDAHTVSQIRFRNISVTVSPSAEEKKSEEGELEAIHDTPHSAISKKAAGFGTECHDMAAVLSGMGVVSAELESLGAH